MTPWHLHRECPVGQDLWGPSPSLGVGLGVRVWACEEGGRARTCRALVDAGRRFGLSPEVWTLSCGTGPSLHCGCHPAVAQPRRRQPSADPENPAAPWTCWVGLGLRGTVTCDLRPPLGEGSRGEEPPASSQGLPREADQPGKRAEGCSSTLGVPQPPPGCPLGRSLPVRSQVPRKGSGQAHRAQPHSWSREPGCRGPLPSERRSVLLVQPLEKAQTGRGPPPSTPSGDTQTQGCPE